jgi:hypothetical protein
MSLWLLLPSCSVCLWGTLASGRAWLGISWTASTSRQRLQRIVWILRSERTICAGLAGPRSMPLVPTTTHDWPFFLLTDPLNRLGW